MIKKLIILLICSCLIFTTGCYAPRATAPAHTTQIKNGDWIRIGYRNPEGKTKWQNGTVLYKLPNAIILRKHKGSEISISRDRVVRIYYLKKKINPGGTLILATGLGIGLAIIGGLSGGPSVTW